MTTDGRFKEQPQKHSKQPVIGDPHCKNGPVLLGGHILYEMWTSEMGFDTHILRDQRAQENDKTDLFS